MIRKFKVELEITIHNKGNLISEAWRKMPVSCKKMPTLEEAIKFTLENASYYVVVQSTTINSGGTQ